MKIFLLGAAGNAGQRILREALARSHEVTAIVRDESKLPSSPNLRVNSRQRGQITGPGQGDGRSRRRHQCGRQRGRGFRIHQAGPMRAIAGFLYEQH